MGSNSVTLIAAALVLCNIIHVNGQWCTMGNAQSLTADNTSVGYITSINYPTYYDDNVDCESTIEATGVGSADIMFYVEYDSIEHFYDYLEIYSDPITASNLLYDSDVYYAPYVGLSSGSPLYAKFHTDSSITYGGFKMYYIAVQNTGVSTCGSSVTATSDYQQLFHTDTSSCTFTITTQDTTGSYGVEVKVLIVRGYVSFSGGSSSRDVYYADEVYVGMANPASVQVTAASGNNFAVIYKQVQVATATNVIITTAAPTDFSICGTDSLKTSNDNTTQYLQSQNYPGQYDNYLYCSVTIEAANSSQSVFVEILDYAVATDDALAIYDGPRSYYNQLDTVSAGSTYTSTGSSLHLVFFTSSVGQNRGFRLSYNSTSRDVPNCVQSFTLDENVTSSATENVIESPNYPGAYYNSETRYWLIVKPSESDTIVLDFRVFNVEEAYECIYDAVSIYDGACTTDPLIAKICGYNPVTFEDNSGLYILIKFQTDSSVTTTGWRLTHYIGQYYDPEASSSTADDSSGIKDYIYPVIGIAVITIIAIVLFTCLYCKSKGRVGAGEAKAPLKKRTTHDLLTELTSRYGSADTDKQTKIKRKGNRYHPQPNLPGPNVNVIHMGGQSPHPPPGHTDPAYPPVFIGTGLLPAENIAPVLTEQSSVTPSAPLPDMSVPSMIPPPFHYMTPTEARAAGLHG